MFKVDTKNLNPGTICYFNGKDKKDGWFELRLANAATIAKIEKVAVKRKAEFKNKQRYEFTDVDNDKFNEMIWDYTIIEWGNIVNESGKALKCDIRNKVMLMSKHMGFAKIYKEHIFALRAAFDKEEKETEKN